jgi:hypothetical protein
MARRKSFYRSIVGKLASPILTDTREQPMFDLVPFAGSRWKMTNGDPRNRSCRSAWPHDDGTLNGPVVTRPSAASLI